MRLEHLPIIFGVIVALIGVGLVVDALTPDGAFIGVERRRRTRAPRHPRGELLVGLGVIAIAMALIGRDAWRYGTIAVLVGVVLLTAGSILNRHYLRELFSHRGALSRTDDGLPVQGSGRTERVVRRPMAPDSAVPDGAPPPHIDERRAKPRGGEGPRRVR